MNSFFNKTSSENKKSKTKKIFYSRAYFNILSKFNGFNPQIKSKDFKDFYTKIRFNALEIKEPELREINPTYALIRNLKIHPEIRLKELPKFENFVKWKNLNLNLITILRDYPLKFISNLKQFSRENILIKISNKINAFDEKQINITKKIKITEELIQIAPYSKTLQKQKLFKLPIARSPLYKSYFPESEMKKFREELATQNQTRWSNVEIWEIYDKFNMKLFSDIRQTSGSKNLLCYPNFSNADIKIEDDFYYLIVGKKRDTGEIIKALSRPVIA
ncbi:MAG: hypothetical protein WCG23_07840 [bacterium]